jgi:hypothetical protein
MRSLAALCGSMTFFGGNQNVLLITAFRVIGGVSHGLWASSTLSTLLFVSQHNSSEVS